MKPSREDQARVFSCARATPRPLKDANRKLPTPAAQASSPFWSPRAPPIRAAEHRSLMEARPSTPAGMPSRRFKRSPTAPAARICAGLRSLRAPRQPVRGDADVGWHLCCGYIGARRRGRRRSSASACASGEVYQSSPRAQGAPRSRSARHARKARVIMRGEKPRLHTTASSTARVEHSPRTRTRRAALKC